MVVYGLFIYSQSDTAYNHIHETVIRPKWIILYFRKHFLFLHSFALYCQLHFCSVSNLLFSFIVYLCFSVHGYAPEREQLKPHQYPSSESQWYDYTHYRITLEEEITHTICMTITTSILQLRNKLLLLHLLQMSFIPQILPCSRNSTHNASFTTLFTKKKKILIVAWCNPIYRLSALYSLSTVSSEICLLLFSFLFLAVSRSEAKYSPVLQQGRGMYSISLCTLDDQFSEWLKTKKPIASWKT